MVDMGTFGARGEAPLEQATIFLSSRRLKSHARPLEDSVDDVVTVALDALDQLRGVKPSKAEKPAPTSKKKGDKLPQREFRIPLLESLIHLGNEAPAKNVRELMEKKMAPRLSAADYEKVSTGDPRWWNAICWERNDMVKEGLMRSDTERGVWGISANGSMVLMKIANAKGK
jgi:hypothetical protein